MEIVKRAIRLMHEGKCIYDQFQLDEDYNVPDAKEDVGNVIEGIVCVKTEDMKLVENYLKISGKAQFKILYMTASLDPQPAVLEGKLPFEENGICRTTGRGRIFPEKSQNRVQCINGAFQKAEPASADRT